MALELRHSLKLKQQLVMTPQLQQAIKMLQLSRQELVETINQELLENPMLLEEETFDDNIDTDKPSQGEDTDDSLNEVMAKEEEPIIEDFDWANYIEEYNSQPSLPYTIDKNSEPVQFENFLTTAPTLEEHLNWQLKFSPLSEDEKAIAYLIIGNLDRDGYLRTSLKDIITSSETNIKDAEKILKAVQQFDPPGIAARDIKECLLIQSKFFSDEQQEVMAEIIENHLNKLESKDYNGIIKAFKRPKAIIKAAIENIINMEPRPARPFGGDKAFYITPDIYIVKVDDEFVILLNEDGLPKLKLSNLYKNVMNLKINVNEKEKEYIQDKLRSASWLIKSIHQRQRTLYKVTESIIKHQKLFFEKGIQYLKPLILKDIADDVDMHESTICRITTNKYCQTPLGLFELKYFFNSSINLSDGDTIASESVKDKIRLIIESENRSKPLSDKAIVEILGKKEIQIARRTVAKYREMMNIQSSNKRRKPKLQDI